LVEAFERLPGIGPKSATRLVFYLLNTPVAYTKDLGQMVAEIKSKVKTCKVCYNMGEDDLCGVCKSDKRKKNMICVVERVVDLLAIENVGGFVGVYHVLGGSINPLDHVGPDDLKILELISRVKKLSETEDEIEVILASNPTMEGEATALYIKKKLEDLGIENLKLTRIGSGLPIGSDLEYADSATVARAMEGRREV